MTQKREQHELEIRKEDKLLLLCARTQMNNEIESQIISLIQQETNWNYLLQRSYEHRLTPLLYWQLKNVCPNSVPKNVMDYLKTFFLENTHKNLLYMGELFRILELFESHGIAAIPYKGPALAVMTYGNLAFREFSDLDIFINQNDAIKAKELLVSDDYNPHINLDPVKDKKFIETQHDYGLSNNEKSITIELHWKFTSSLFSLPLKEEEIFNLNIPTYHTINGHRVRSLYSEDLLLILCIHNAGHRWSDLAWICDIAEFIQHNNINWGKVIWNARKMGSLRILLINLNLAKDLIGLELPDEILPYLKSDNELEKISNQINFNLFLKNCDKTSLLEEIILNLKIRDKTFWGVKDSINSAVKPTTYEWTNIPLPIFLYPFYYLLRPFMLIKRYNI
jgi:hypothetical protein